MKFSQRITSVACGVFALWGAAGCDTSETTAPEAGTAAVAVESEPAEKPIANVSPAKPDAPAATSSTSTEEELVEVAAATGNSTPADAPSSTPATPVARLATPPTPAPTPPVDRPRATSNVAARPGETQEVTFDTIKLPLEKDQPFKRELLTPQVLALDGKPIRIRGYILPSFQQTGITQFVLVRDNLQCCFGPGAALHDCIIVEMKPGKSADYTVRPVSVEGKFTLAELVSPDDGKHLAIYHLDGEKVQ